MVGSAERYQLTVLQAAAGTRLDRWLVDALPGLSRARVQVLIDARHVRVDGAARKASYRLQGGEAVEVDIPPPEPVALEAEPLELSVLYEDDQVIVVDKPAGMVVHPGAGQTRGTLAAAVLAHAPEVAGVGSPRRPGIVHRLDKGTSGVLVLAKTQAAYASLTAQLKARTVSRRYVAVVHGRVRVDEGSIDAPIGRDPLHRKRMAVRPPGKGRRAVTRYRVLERLPGFTVLEVRLETGRTHQIRVHLASIGHPVVGDDTYGRSRGQATLPIAGVGLHAATLAFRHPVTGDRLELSAPWPIRLERLLSHLRNIR